MKRKRRFPLVLVVFLGILVWTGFVVHREVELQKQLATPAGDVIRDYAQANDLDPRDYPASLIELLGRNPETRDFVLSYPQEHDREQTIDLSGYDLSQGVPLFMQWDKRWGYTQYGGDVAGLTGCGPVCLSMAGYYLTGDEAFAPDKMLEFAKKEGYCKWNNGTSWTLISEGAVELGLDVTEIPLVESRILDNLEVGNPIICVMGPGDFTTSGHYIVLTGTENGLIRVNDPNSYENSSKLWDYDDIEDQFRNLWVIRYFG